MADQSDAMKQFQELQVRSRCEPDRRRASSPSSSTRDRDPRGTSPRAFKSAQTAEGARVHPPPPSVSPAPQAKFVETTQKAKHLTQTIMQREQDIRRSALTGTEMSPLPDDVGCYKGLGRAFVKEPKSVVMETLENTVKASTAEIEQCKQQREYLQKTLTETETNIKELLQGNEALSRELLQNGYQ